MVRLTVRGRQIDFTLHIQMVEALGPAYEYIKVLLWSGTLKKALIIKFTVAQHDIHIPL